MKKIWNAKYKSGLMSDIRVYGKDESDAKKAAFAAYTFNSAMTYPGYKIDDVVESVSEVDGGMTGIIMQPQVECSPGDDVWKKCGFDTVEVADIKIKAFPKEN